MSEKFGLVLEGGGVRGAFTAGALAWLNDHGIEFDYSAGISSGAMYLTCYMMKNKTTAYNIATDYACQAANIGFQALLKEGYYVAYNRLFDECLKKQEAFTIDSLIEKDPAMEIGVYDLDRGETVFVRAGKLDRDLKTLQGACALPVASAIVEINGHHYLDGGITKMIPIERAIEQGCTKFLVITTKSANYVRKPGSPIVKFLMKMMYKQYPQMVEDYNVRHLNYYKQIDLIKGRVESGDCIHILPSKDFPVSRFHGDPEVTKVLYKLGYEDMEARKDEILAFLGK